MKTILTTFLITLSVIGHSQDTTFYDIHWDEVSSITATHRYEVLVQDQNDTNDVVISTYLKSGQIVLQESYYPYVDKTLQGKKSKWYKNGNIQREMFYKEGQLHGELVTYWENGEIKRKDTYIEGELESGTCFNEKGKEVKFYPYRTDPEFKGGLSKMYEYLSLKVEYPDYSRNHNVSGRVIVSFVVEKNGRISNVKVIQSVSKGLDTEAIRVINKMPKWKPGTIDGDLVRVRFKLPISFKLE